MNILHFLADYGLSPVAFFLLMVFFSLLAVRLWTTRGKSRAPVIAAALALVAAAPAINGVPIAFSTAGLKNLPTSTLNPIVWRLGFRLPGDVPAIAYVGSSSPCTANAGAGDNGACIPSANGGSWLAAMPLPADVREFGGVFDSVTDNGPALQNAVNAYPQVLIPLPPNANSFVINTTVSLSAGVTVIRPGLSIAGCVLTTANVDTFDIGAGNNIIQGLCAQHSGSSGRIVSDNGLRNGGNQLVDDSFGASNNAATSAGVYFNSSGNQVRHSFFTNLRTATYAVQFDATGGTIRIANKIEDSFFGGAPNTGAGSQIYFGSSDASARQEGCFANDNFFTDTGPTNLWLAAVLSCHIIGNEFDGGEVANIVLAPNSTFGVGLVSFVGNWIGSNNTANSIGVQDEYLATSSAASISGTTLTVGGTVTGIWAVGQAVFMDGVATATTITGLGSGSGGAGTYTVNNSQTLGTESAGGGFAVNGITFGDNNFGFSANGAIFHQLSSSITFQGNHFDSITGFTMAFFNSQNVTLGGNTYGAGNTGSFLTLQDGLSGGPFTVANETYNTSGGGTFTFTETNPANFVISPTSGAKLAGTFSATEAITSCNQTVFTIAHGLAGTPQLSKLFASVAQPASGAAGYSSPTAFIISADSLHVQVGFQCGTFGSSGNILINVQGSL